jgi:putative Mn2+ efflux pump MntP
VDGAGRLYSPWVPAISLAKAPRAGVVGVVGFGEILLLAVGLAMDATAVAAARGLAVPVVRPRHMALVALFFGGAQALMPLLGWLVGARVGPLVQAWDHWIVFVLLSALGGKMVYEALAGDDDDDGESAEADPFALRVMLVLAVATSIDALAVGFTLPMMDAPLVLSLLTIGVTTALLSVVGLLVGRRFGALLGPRLDLAGGLVLILLGAKVLVEHLSA